VGRELIRNVERHARAKHLRLEVTCPGQTIVLVVADDGRGFDHHLVYTGPLQGHIGLAAMAERVEAVGGSFSIGGGPGSGTTIEVRIPLEAPASGPPIVSPLIGGQSIPRSR
jgi:two-component system NarL family sensor kinase